MKKRQTEPSTTTAQSRRSAAYWRTRYEQLQSDFDELLAVNQTILNRTAELERMIVIDPSLCPVSKSLEDGCHFYVPEDICLFHQPTTTKSKPIKGKKS